MVNINFVPDDYIQNNESRRTNLIYLVLFAVVMTVLGGSFTAIKIRQRACYTSEKAVNARIAEIQEAIKRFEELQTKRREMMKTALTTAELIEPVPRSILLASLTNNLPIGVSLLELNFVQKESKQNNKVATTSKYQATQAQKRTSQQGTQIQQDVPENPEQLLETHIDIGGMAPSDLQVAAYIERLSNSSLLDHVALVESKEFKIDDNIFRQFKLKAMLRKDVQLTNDDIKSIRDVTKNTVFNF